MLPDRLRSACAAEPLGEAVALEYLEEDLGVTAGHVGASLAVMRCNRGDGFNHKIYVSLLQHDGSWGHSELVDELNMPGAADCRLGITSPASGREPR
jgi:hypothetical protein